jgi:thioredoxin 1
MTFEKVDTATDETFGDLTIKSELPALAYFWAPWCGPCRTVGPIVEELAEDYKDNLIFVKINVDKGQRTAMSLGVLNIPAFILFFHGEPVGMAAGAQSKAALKDRINQWLHQINNSALS